MLDECPYLWLLRKDIQSDPDSLSSFPDFKGSYEPLHFQQSHKCDRTVHGMSKGARTWNSHQSLQGLRNDKEMWLACERSGAPIGRVE